MEIIDILAKIKKDLAEKLNAFLRDAQLPEMEISDYAPDWENDEYKLGLYLASPEGMVFNFNPRSTSSEISVTIDLLIDRNVKNSVLADRYLSILVVFFLTRNYAFASYPGQAVTSRVDNGAAANAVVLEVKIVIDHQFDGKF